MTSRLFSLLAPFDIEAYQRVHFTKVGVQTLQMLDAWIAAGRARNLPVSSLTMLRDTLVEARSRKADTATGLKAG